MIELTQKHLMNPKGVGVIVIKNNKVLLGKRTDNGKWGLAGGGIEDGETPKQAAIRELYEEFGIQNENIKYFGVSYSPINPDKKSDSSDGCSIDFFVEYNDSEDIKISLSKREFSEYKWVDLNDVLKEDLYVSSKHSLELFLRV